MLAFQAGDEGAFNRIVARYQTSVFHFVLRTIHDEGRAEDLTQEVFVRVYRSRDRYQPSASFRTWLFTIANRLALNEVRATRRRKKIFTDGAAKSKAAGGDDGESDADDFWANVPDRGGEAPSERVERKEMEEMIERLLERLPANQRSAIQLQRSELFSYQEIAEALDVSVMAVKALLVRARETLKVELERYLEGRNHLMGKKP